MSTRQKILCAAVAAAGGSQSEWPRRLRLTYTTSWSRTCRSAGAFSIMHPFT